MKKTVFILLLLCIGTLQVSATRWYVTQNGAGNNNGLSWANAKPGTSLVALMISLSATAFDTVWVATGIYYTSDTTTNSDFTKTFWLGDKISMYGGFAGTETNVAQRNIAANPTILSGDNGADSIEVNNARHVVTINFNATLDGFIIQDGYAYGNVTSCINNCDIYQSGGGIFITEYGYAVFSGNGISPDTVTVTGPNWRTVKIANCTIRNNYSSGNGAGVYINSMWRCILDISFDNCKFLKNMSNYNGGAIYATSTKPHIIYQSNLNFTHINITPDSAHGDLTLRLNNCVLDTNRSPSNNAGAIYLDASATVVNAIPAFKTYINGCSFKYNTAGANATIAIALGGGGNMKSRFDSLSISNSNFIHNWANASSSVIGTIGSADSSGLFNYSIYNCNFSNNSFAAGGSGSGVFYSSFQGAMKGEIKKCSFTNNQGTFGASCLNFNVGNQSVFPQLYKSSLLIDSSIFMANTDTNYNGVGVMDLLFSNPTDTFVISNSVISKNKGQYQTVYARSKGAIKFINCDIDSNTFHNPANGGSAPIFIDANQGQTYSSFENCRMRYNKNQSSNNYGSGAVKVISSSDTSYIYFNNCKLTNNLGYYGGAIQLSGFSTNAGPMKLFLTNSIISGNEALGVGGAISTGSGASGSSITTITNCLISGNKSAQDGGAIYCRAGVAKLTIYNSTIASNYIGTAGGYGAGVYYYPSTSIDTVRIFNSIFWDNTSVSIPNTEIHSERRVKILNSIVQGGLNSLLYNITAQNVIGYDPRFAAPVSSANAPTSSGDYHLQLCSPGVNRGNNAYVSATQDLDFTARIKQTTVDLGAFESNHNNGLEIPVAISSYQRVCELTSYPLYVSGVSGASSVSWTGPRNFTSSSVNPVIITPDHIGIYDSTHIYHVIASYANGCSLDDTVAVWVTPAPKVEITTHDTSVCAPSFYLSLNANMQNAVYTPDLKLYRDSIAGTPVSTALPYNITLSSPAVFYLQVTETSNGCSVMDSAKIIVAQKPDTPAISGNLTLCAGDTLALNASTVNGTTYFWKGPGTFSASSQNIQRLNADTSMKGQYSVYAIRNGALNSCDSSEMASVNVMIYARPSNATINGNTNVLISSINNYNVTATSGSSYNWMVSKGTINSGNGSNSISVTWDTAAGTGFVKVIETSSNSCKGDTLNLTINISQASVPDSLSISSNTLHFTAAGSTQNIQLSSNRTWIASGWASWVSIIPNPGSGNTMLIITASANSSSSSRNTTAIFTAGTVVKTLLINQDSTPSVPDQLSLDKDTIVFSSTLRNTSLQISSNRSWTVTNPASWLTVTPMNGSNNATLNLSVPIASNPSVRNTDLTLTAGTIIKKVFIKQEADPVGLHEVSDLSEIIIYPNPSYGLVVIENKNTEDFNVSVFDMNGKLTDRFKLIASSKMELDYRSLEAGLYFLNAKSETLNYNSKILLLK
ncbi:MAG: T9SS type A sorting domain-containing protein [Bacteroidota bacterium]|nr:T9SS type A sorting domain-containing protein [Bacteroidota bacterium]